MDNLREKEITFKCKACISRVIARVNESVLIDLEPVDIVSYMPISMLALTRVVCNYHGGWTPMRSLFVQLPV